MRQVLILLSLMLGLSAWASERRLAIITSDIDAEIRDFYLITNDDNVVDSVRYVTYLRSGHILEDKTVPAHVVMEEGTVIVERDGRDAVRLETEKDFNVNAGGTIRLNYLYSGVTGNRRVHKLLLKKEDGVFTLKDTKDQEVNSIFVLGNWHRILGLIGIREIQTSLKP